MVYLHTCFDQYSTKYLNGTLCRLCRPLSLHLSPLWYSAQLSLVALVPLDFQFCLLNSRRPPGSAWVGFLFCTTAWENSQMVSLGNHRFHLFLFSLSGITILHCLISSDLNSVVSYIFLVSVVVSGRNINRVYLALSYLEVEIWSFHFKMKTWSQDWELQEDLVPWKVTELEFTLNSFLTLFSKTWS